MIIYMYLSGTLYMHVYMYVYIPVGFVHLVCELWWSSFDPSLSYCTLTGEIPSLLNSGYTRTYTLQHKHWACTCTCIIHNVYISNHGVGISQNTCTYEDVWCWINGECVYMLFQRATCLDYYCLWWTNLAGVCVCVCCTVVCAHVQLNKRTGPSTYT